MQLHQIQPKTGRKGPKRVGRGGKRGTTSGGGTKGQKGRAGASVKPGFRGGDNRIWQLFPKQPGASHKPGNKRPHKKHRFYRLHHGRPSILNVSDLNVFNNGDTVSLQTLAEHKLIESERQAIKILGGGALGKKLTVANIPCSASAKEKIAKAGGSIVLA